MFYCDIQQNTTGAGDCNHWQFKDVPLHPGTAFRAVEHCLNYFHVGYGVFDWCGDAGVIQDGLRKGVALERVLIADVKLDFLDFFSILIPDFAGFVWRCIEGYFDLYAT